MFVFTKNSMRVFYVLLSIIFHFHLNSHSSQKKKKNIVQKQTSQIACRADKNEAESLDYVLINWRNKKCKIRVHLKCDNTIVSHILEI